MHFFPVDLVAGLFSSLIRSEADLVILVEGGGGGCATMGGVLLLFSFSSCTI